MDTTNAVTVQILAKLEDSFGKAVAMLIVMSASTKAKLPTSDLTVGQYRQLVDAICCDQRVLDMWGEAGAEEARNSWESLL